MGVVKSGLYLYYICSGKRYDYVLCAPRLRTYVNAVAFKLYSIQNEIMQRKLFDHFSVCLLLLLLFLLLSWLLDCWLAGGWLTVVQFYRSECRKNYVYGGKK